MKKESFWNTVILIYIIGFYESRYIKLPQSFITAVLNPNFILKKPFLLIPLFKIFDKECGEVNYKFFEDEKYNRIQSFSDNELCYLASERNIDVCREKFTMKFGKGRCIDLNRSIFSNFNGYFIFKNPHSDCAMVYVGVFIERYLEIFLKSEFGEMYNHYTRNIPSNNYNIKNGNISFELEIDITAFIENISLEACINEERSSILLNLNLPEELKKFPSNLVIKLRGTKIRNGNLYLEIQKYYNSKSVDDLYFPMNRKV